MKSFGVTSVVLLTLVLAGPFAGEAQVLQPSALCSDQPDAAIATFEDADLEAAVRSALSVSARDDLTCGLVSGLTDLHAEGAGIESLVGVQNLTGLTRLSLDSNSITDISPLSELTSLTGLNLEENSITDISPLSGLTSLTFLDLYSNSITDLSPVSGLTSLTFLDLQANPMTDLSALSGLTSLRDLNLRSNSISDISAVSKLTSLTLLHLGDNSISDVSALSGLTSLTFLNLSDNPALTDIQPLVDNAGLGAGDSVNVLSTGVSCSDRDALVAKRVSVRCVPRVALPDESVVFNTFEQPQIRVVTVTKGLSYPWGMAFLPDGGILVTERTGHLRLIRDGVLNPDPIRGGLESCSHPCSTSVAMHARPSLCVAWIYTTLGALHSFVTKPMTG